MHLVDQLAKEMEHSRYGPVMLTYDVAQPVHGSVRPIARAAGCGLRDTLVLGFRPPTGELVVERHPGPAPQLPFTHP